MSGEEQATSFPHLDRIEPVLAAIEGMPEFKVNRRDAYTTIDYSYMRSETFGSLALDPPEQHAAIRLRREARGLKFDADGKLLARPFHKFFNLGEKPEVQAHLLPWREPHVILDKIDGSMVHPITLGSDIRWATRNGETEQSALAAAHMDESGLPYTEMARDLTAEGLLPLFEFVSPRNRIVVAYPQAQAMLLAVRRKADGRYVGDVELRAIAAQYGIPVVKAWGADVGSVDQFIAHTRGLMHAEGYVVRFADGVMIKLKADAYALRHGALSDIASEKYALRLALEGGEDDVIPLLPAHIGAELADYTRRVRAAIAQRIAEIDDFLHQARARIGDDRKAYAAMVLADLPARLRSVAFKAWEGADVGSFLRGLIVRETASFDRIDEVRGLINGETWSAAVQPDE